jgi:hypothetical protein
MLAITSKPWSKSWVVLTGRAVEIEAASRQVARLMTAREANAAYNRHPGLKASGSTPLLIVAIVFPTLPKLNTA